MSKIKSRPREIIHNDAKQNLIEGGKVWAEYWRKNIEIFIEQYMGIKLFTFQKILIHMMHKSSFFVWIACRGLGGV